MNTIVENTVSTVGVVSGVIAVRLERIKTCLLPAESSRPITQTVLTVLTQTARVICGLLRPALRRGHPMSDKNRELLLL
jgi:hypothetical protein